MDQVGALILAAATGSGFGGVMALGRWGEGTLLEHLVSVARDAGVAVIVVVVGPRSDDVIAACELGDALIVINDDYEEGDASSLRAGLDTMWRIEEIETAIVMELEHAGVSASEIESVAAEPRDALAPITVPKYRYARSSPIAVDRALWPRLMGLEGRVDLLDLTAAHPDWVREVRLDSAPPKRVRTPDDLSVVERRRRLT